MNPQQNFVVDKKGKTIAVQIPVQEYKKLLADAEQLADIRAYRKAKTHKSDPIPFEQAFREIEKSMR